MEEQEQILDLIIRYEQRLRLMYKNPNPYIAPAFEYKEIKDKIEELKLKINGQ